MKSKPVALLGIISLLCTLFAFPIVIQAAPNVLQVTFYQDGDLQLRPNNNFILGSYSSAIDFIAVINHNEVPNDVKMTVTGPSSYSKTFDRIALSNGRYGFSGTLPNVTGLYKVSYFSASQTIAYAATTPLELGIHYRADASLNKSSLRIGDSNIRLNCTIRDRNGSVVTVRPRIELRGATFDNLNFSGNGTFTLDIGQITAAGTDALKLLFDDVVVYTWDVNASPFPALTIDPGILFVDKPQQIIISALGHDLYHTGLSEINNALLRVELEGVPIAKSSITRVPIDYESTGIVYGEETYRRVVLLASDLEVDAIRFTGGGTLRLKISDLDNRYESIVELPVQYAANAEGIFGGPIYQNYASESSFSYEFNLPNGKQVKEYSMIAFITDQEQVEISETASSGSYLYNTTPVSFNCSGYGTISVQVTTTDRDGEVRDWLREFTYGPLPVMELSQQVVPLDEEHYLAVFLYDSTGRPINDATVEIDGLGRRSNSGNGEYLFSGKWTTPGFKRVQAYGSDGALLADYARAFRVQAPELLLLEADSESILAGAAQTISFKVIDETGREITGARILAYVDNSPTPIYSTWNSASRMYQVRLTNPLRKVVFVAESGDRRKVSPELEIAVVQPKIVSNLEKLTDLFAEYLELSFINPVTGESLSGTVSLRTQNLIYQERNVRNQNGVAGSKTGTSVTLEVYKRATGSASSALIVDFTYSGKLYSNLLTLPVEPAQITVTPDALQPGTAQTVTLEALGASGNPLAGLDIAFQGESSVRSVTNDRGRVSFSVTPKNTVEQYTFTVTRTDSLVQTGGRATTVEIAVPVSKTTAPLLEIINVGNDDIVRTDRDSFVLHLRLVDEDGLDYLWVNSDRIPLNGKLLERNETINLLPGENKVILELYNRTGLLTKRELTIIYTPVISPPIHEPEPTIMRIGDFVVRQGDKVLESPPIPPQIVNGRTMLPFRYLCQTVMGGTVHYEAETRKIYTTVNGHDIVMQVDNPEMTVDGITYTQTQAPIIESDYTLVPVRALEQVVYFIDWDANTQTVTLYP